MRVQFTAAAEQQYSTAAEQQYSTAAHHSTASAERERACAEYGVGHHWISIRNLGMEVPTYAVVVGTYLPR